MAAEAGIFLASTAAQERKDTQGHVASPSIVMTTINKGHLSLRLMVCRCSFVEDSELSSYRYANWMTNRDTVVVVVYSVLRELPTMITRLIIFTNRSEIL